MNSTRITQLPAVDNAPESLSARLADISLAADPRTHLKTYVSAPTIITTASLRLHSTLTDVQSTLMM